VCCGMMEGACVLWYDGHFRGVKMSKKITEWAAPGVALVRLLISFMRERMSTLLFLKLLLSLVWSRGILAKVRNVFSYRGPTLEHISL
jgi:hypothetical protein